MPILARIAVTLFGALLIHVFGDFIVFAILAIVAVGVAAVLWSLFAAMCAAIWAHIMMIPLPWVLIFAAAVFGQTPPGKRFVNKVIGYFKKSPVQVPARPMLTLTSDTTTEIVVIAPSPVDLASLFPPPAPDDDVEANQALWDIRQSLMGEESEVGYTTMAIRRITESQWEESRGINSTLYWSHPDLVKIEQLRLTVTPGAGGIWNVEFCWGRTNTGKLVNVELPFSRLPQHDMTRAIFEYGLRDHVKPDSLRLYRAISLFDELPSTDIIDVDFEEIVTPQPPSVAHQPPVVVHQPPAVVDQSLSAEGKARILTELQSINANLAREDLTNVIWRIHLMNEAEAINRTLSWTSRELAKIEWLALEVRDPSRLRIRWSVDYCWGRTASGELVNVDLPFEHLPLYFSDLKDFLRERLGFNAARYFFPAVSRGSYPYRSWGREYWTTEFYGLCDT